MESNYRDGHKNISLKYFSIFFFQIEKKLSVFKTVKQGCMNGFVHYYNVVVVVAVWFATQSTTELCNTKQEHEYDGNCLVLHD